MQSTRRRNVIVFKRSSRAALAELSVRATERDPSDRRCTLPGSLIKDGWWLEGDTISYFQRRTATKEH